MTPEQIAGLEALLEEVTPGPWYYVDSLHGGEFFGCGVSKAEYGTEFIWFDDAIDPEKDIANARLVALAPTLARHVLTQQAQIEALESVLTELHAMVRGECPSLLNEDSGGDAQLAYSIEYLIGGDA